MNIEFNKTYYAKKEIDVYTFEPLGGDRICTINIGDVVTVVGMNVIEGDDIVVLKSDYKWVYLTREKAEKILTEIKPIVLSTMADDEIADLIKNYANSKTCCGNCILLNSNQCMPDLMKEAAKRLGGKK